MAHKNPFGGLTGDRDFTLDPFNGIDINSLIDYGEMQVVSQSVPGFACPGDDLTG